MLPTLRNVRAGGMSPGAAETHAKPKALERAKCAASLWGVDMAMDPVESQYKPWAKDAMGGAKSIVVTGAGKTQCRSQTTRGREKTEWGNCGGWNYQPGWGHAYDRRTHRDQMTERPDRWEADGWALVFGGRERSGSLGSLTRTSLGGPMRTWLDGTGCPILTPTGTGSAWRPHRKSWRWYTCSSRSPG
jgi:hypothetical protein